MASHRQEKGQERVRFLVLLEILVYLLYKARDEAQGTCPFQVYPSRIYLQ